MATLTAKAIDTAYVTKALAQLLQNSFIALGQPGHLKNTEVTAVNLESDADGFTVKYNTQCITTKTWEKEQSIFMPMEAANSLVATRAAVWVGKASINEIQAF